MPLYELTGNELQPIPQWTFAELGLPEREDIQRALRMNIEAITPGVKTMVLAEEFRDWEGASRRIDLLCLDSEARLVVVELKRDNGAHMELQALRYAAMVSTMRFDQAVDAHRRFLRAIGSQEDAEQRIRKHLGIGDAPGALSETVRIVLASLDFPPELTTAVLWLNKQGLDLRCVQMRPHRIDGRTLLDIQQVIPLPSAAQYQVAVREKSNEQVQAQNAAGRDRTKFDLTIGDETLTNLPKRRLVYEVVAEAIRHGITPREIGAAVPWRTAGMFFSAAGELDRDQLQATDPAKSLDRFFADAHETFFVDGMTHALTNQWGDRTLSAVELIITLFPEGTIVDVDPSAPVDDEVAFEGLTIRQRENGTIEVVKDGVLIQPVKPVLRDIAARFGLPLTNGRGSNLNTRQLGAKVMQEIQKAGDSAAQHRDASAP